METGKVPLPRVLPWLVLVVLVSLGHWTVLAGQFVGDDHAAIELNRLVRGPLDLQAIATTNYWWGYQEQESSLYRPVTVLAHHAVDRLGNGSPTVHRAVNVILHIGVVFEVLALASILVGSRRWGFFAAALFAVHPLHVEPVALIVGRADLLAALLGLEAWRLARRGSRLALFGAAGMALAACSAKESAFPLILAAAGVQLFRGEGDLVARVRSALPLGAALVVAMVLRVSILGAVGYPGPPPFSDNPLFHLELGERLRGGLAVASTYLGLLVAPRVLSADYSFDQIPVPGSWGSAPVVLALVGLLALVILALRWRRPAAVGAALALVTYAPVANLLIPIRTVAGERLLYIPSIGLLALSAVAASQLARRWPRAVLVFCVVALAAGTGRSALRGLDWQSDFVLNRVTAETSPRSWRAHTAFAKALEAGGRSARARQHFEEAIRINPRVASNQRALARLAREEGDAEEARRWLLEANEAQPGDMWVVLELAQLELAQAQSPAEVEVALARFERVGGQTGPVPSVRIGRAGARLALGDAEAAEAELMGLLETRPDRAADVLAVWVPVKLALGQPRVAAEAVEELLDRGPTLEPGARAELERLRAAAWEAAGREDRARAAWMRLLIADPPEARALPELARLAGIPSVPPGPIEEGGRGG